MITTMWGLLVAYVLGSIPTGYLVGRWVKGVDIRQHGSGNVGASNVLRVVGRRWGIIVLVFDIFKGWLAVTLVYSLTLQSDIAATALVGKLALGFAAICGHNWTIFLRFKGGKGVATTCGVFLSVVPEAAGAALLVWALVVALTRFISAASISAAWSCPLWIWLFYRSDVNFHVLLVVSFLIPVLICYTHRSNLRRLLHGTENQIGGKVKKTD